MAKLLFVIQDGVTYANWRAVRQSGGLGGQRRGPGVAGGARAAVNQRHLLGAGEGQGKDVVLDQLALAPTILTRLGVAVPQTKKAAPFLT